jgi:hypothetical protein
VQQGQGADQRLVRVGVGPAPSPEEATLFRKAQRLAGKAPPGQASEALGRVDQHELVLACPTEEVTRSLQTSATVRRLRPEERLDIVDRDDGPFLFRPLRS